MADKHYFERLYEKTPTRIWVNNPTTSQAQIAIAHGALHCTTNPAYTGKMVVNEEMIPLMKQWIREALRETGDHSEAAAIVQRKAVKHLCEIFLPLYQRAPGEMGFVSIQVDPNKEHDADAIIREALIDREMACNTIAKIPVTEAGIEAITYLVKKDVPTIATEIMSISQCIAICEAYREASQRTGNRPPFFVTCIAGIFDQRLKMDYEEGKLDVDYDTLFQAGMTLMRRQYRLMRERKYPGILLGGGARGLHHFTEFVGGDVHITINWKGTADELVQKNEPIICRMDTPTPEYVLDELLAKVPDFKRAYMVDGLKPEEFAEFPPVALFRSQFFSGWNTLLAAITQEAKV